MIPGSISRKLQILLDTSQRLIHRRASHSLKKILAKTHPADVASLFTYLTPKDRWYLFELITDEEIKAEIVSEMDKAVRLQVLARMKPNDLVPILNEMSSDDLADLVEELPQEVADEVLTLMDDEETREVEDLLGYDADTAGGLMSPDIFALRESTTAEAAIEAMRKTEDVEMAFYIYVVNEHEHLVGVVSLRELVVAPPEQTLSDIMNDNVISVRTDMDQEEVARLVAQYNFLAIPVVDESNKLLGIVTVDDIIDVLKEEADEDFMRMAGAGEALAEKHSIPVALKGRLPWLIVSAIGGILAALVAGSFTEVVAAQLALVWFMPLVLVLGSNVVTQSSTITIRSLTDPGAMASSAIRRLLREVVVGSAMGLAYGLLSAAVGWLMVDLHFALVLGASIATTCLVAATIGSVLPLSFQRLHLDPAMATAPVVSSIVVILATTIYLSLGLLFQHLLG